MRPTCCYFLSAGCPKPFTEYAGICRNQGARRKAIKFLQCGMSVLGTSRHPGRYAIRSLSAREADIKSDLSVPGLRRGPPTNLILFLVLWSQQGRCALFDEIAQAFYRLWRTLHRRVDVFHKQPVVVRQVVDAGEHIGDLPVGQRRVLGDARDEEFKRTSDCARSRTNLRRLAAALARRRDS
jgi:hypothetical protein